LITLKERELSQELNYASEKVNKRLLKRASQPPRPLFNQIPKKETQRKY
jgi:hypothetical protein